MKVSEHNPTSDSLEGVTVMVLEGEYEVMNYTIEGPAFSDEIVEVPHDIQGVLINSQHEVYNVSVMNEAGQQVIIGVPRSNIMRPL